MGGTVWLLPIVIIGGILILRKVQRFEMFATYVVAYLAMTLFTATPDMYGDLLSQTFLSSPLLFCGFAMLTEPMTAPAAKWPSLGFGALVGAALIAAATYWRISTLRLRLHCWWAMHWPGSINPKYRFKLTLERIEKTAIGLL